MRQRDSLTSLQAAVMDDMKRKIAGYRMGKKQAQQEKDMLYEICIGGASGRRLP